jgi:DNA-binding cell septation regulator SpoVG
MNNLTITSTNILPIENGIGGCVALAQVILNDAIKLTGLKLVENNGKRYITYPRNTSNKQNKSYFYPIDQEVAGFICNRLWSDYEAGLNA